MTHPAYNGEEARTRETFLALMWSLSYPGCIYNLPVAGDDCLRAIADTLLDLETSFYTPDTDLKPYLSRNGARALDASKADYHFYPAFTHDMLNTVQQANLGTLMYPDQSATLIIGCTFGSGTNLALSGPGIPTKESCHIQVEAIPTAFWTLRKKAMHYPRGWDVYLVSQSHIIGLPRTTQIAAEEQN